MKNCQKNAKLPYENLLMLHKCLYTCRMCGCKLQSEKSIEVINGEFTNEKIC